jgi:trigger factor
MTVANKVTITDAGPCLKKMHIEIPADAVAAKLKESFAGLATYATVPGFRAGRVPMRMIEAKFGKDVRNEAKQQLISQAYQKAVEEHKIKTISDPSAEGLIDLEVVDGKPLSFELEVEVVPEFTLPNLEGIAVKKPLYEATDKMITDELNKFAVQEGSLEERQESEPGDYLTGHAILTSGKDSKEYYNLKGAVVQVPPTDKEGKGMILGILVDDFSKQLGLPKPGAKVTIKAKGPENHELEELRGKDLTVTFEIERCDRIIPKPLADLVTMLGYPDEATLREAVKTRLGQRMNIEQAVAMRRQIAEFLIENTKMDLPARATAAQTARMIEQKRLELMYRGFEAQQIEEHVALIRSGSAEAAVRELKLFFILNTAADNLNVQVNEQDFNARIVQMAMERNVRPDKMRDEIIRQNAAHGIIRQIREHKAMDAILAKATVTDISVEEWEKSQKKK